MINIMMFWQFRISVVFLLIFLVMFLPLRYGRLKTGFCLLGCFVVTGVLDYFLLVVKGDYQSPVALTLVEIVVVQITPFLISKYRDFRTMFVGFTAAAYVLAGNVISSLLFIAGVKLPVNILCQSLVHALLLGFLVAKMRESVLESLESSDLHWGELCMIPAMFYTAVYTLSTWPANIYRQPENLLGVCCILVLIVCSYVMIIQLFISQKRDSELKRGMEYLENYANRLKTEADTIHEKEREAAVMRHDLKHYSIMINSYLDEGRKDEIRDLLRELNEHVNETKTVRYCENLAVNGIIVHCAKQAAKQRIYFEASLEIPQKMQINEFEFATVVSNLMENAINAAAQIEDVNRRFVKISAHGVKGKLILQISNSCFSEPEISKFTGLPVSAGGGGHGYGMQSVRAFVNKNDAIFDFTWKDDIFYVKMLVRI